MRYLAAVFLAANLLGPTGAMAQQNLLRIAAVVNDDIISVIDLDQRLRLTALSSGIRLDAATRERLLPQVLRTLIDERLQLQHATSNSIRVNDRQIDRRIEDLAQQNKIPPEQLPRFMADRGIDINTLRLQVEAQIAWSSYVERRLVRQTNITQEDVDEEIARRDTQANQPHKRTYEIFLSADNPDRLPEVVQNAERLLGQIRGGADFAAIARNFSQSSSARNGGDLGWVAAGQLPLELDQALAQLDTGMVSPPIRTLTGVHLLYVARIREGQQTGSAGTIDLAQMSVLISKANSPDRFEATRQELSTLSGSIGSCETLEAAAKARTDANIAKADGIAISDLPENVRAAVSGLADGQTTAPIETAVGLLVITRCGGQADTGPDRDLIFRQLVGAALERLAQRTLRDLRRDAFIDVRL